VGEGRRVGSGEWGHPLVPHVSGQNLAALRCHCCVITFLWQEMFVCYEYGPSEMWFMIGRDCVAFVRGRMVNWHKIRKALILCVIDPGKGYPAQSQSFHTRENRFCYTNKIIC